MPYINFRIITRLFVEILRSPYFFVKMHPRLTRNSALLFIGRGVQIRVRNLATSNGISSMSTGLVRIRPSFPWLQKYKFYSGIQGFYNHARLKRTFDILSELIDLDGQGEVLRSQMTRSGIEALRASATSILREAQEKYKVIKENITIQEEKNMNVITCPAMKDILDEKLAKFYDNAIHDQFSYSDQLCTYSLHNIHRSTIVDVKILVNAQRGIPLPKHDFSTVSYGLICFVDDSKVASANPLKLRAYIESLVTGKNYNVCTVQVKLNVDCTETFAIMDAESKFVVQGSLFPSKVTHQVVLENTIDGATRKLGDKWLVVDIDEWLQGNKFWEMEPTAS